jgi:formate hydrogenlyase subunit 3/multisubunit Na+/H+ antiporter MnhD subunit
MLLYPLWVVLASVPCVYLTARYTRNSVTTLVASLCFLMSSVLVLHSFCRFTVNTSFSSMNGLFVWEVTRFSVAASFLFVAVSIPCLMLYLPTVAGRVLPQVSALIHLLIFSALGSLFAADVLSFTILLEGVPLFAIALAALGARVRTGPYQYVLYFVPFLVLLSFAAVSADGTHEINALCITGGTSLLLAATVAARLLLFPFGQPALHCLPLGKTAAVSYALFALPAIALSALVKFMPRSSTLGYVVLILASFSMIVWALLCYKQREPARVIVYSYLAQTAMVTTMVVYGLWTGRSLHGASFLILGNHVISGLGVLLCASLDDTTRGRFGSLALLFFIFCLLGLPPSPGFFGRLMLFKASFAAPDIAGYLLRLSFLANLFVVYCQSKHLGPVVERMKSGVRTPRTVVIALALLAGYLVTGMLFLSQLREYLTGLSL